MPPVAPKRRVLASAALLTLALTARPAPVLAVEICTPDSARQAYDALVAAAPDGSEPETQARRIADDARARGKFESDDTISRLDQLARSADYFWDCQDHAYVYERLDEDAEDEEAVYDDAPGMDPAEAALTQETGDGPAPRSGQPEGSEPATGQTTTEPKATRPGSSPRAGARPSPASGGSSSSAGAGEDNESREAAGPAVPAASPEGTPSAGLTVSAGPEGDDRPDDGPGGPLRWGIGGGLIAALAVVVRRQRRG